MSAGRTALRILLPLVVLAVGIVAMGMMVKSRKKAEKTRPERQAPLVEAGDGVSFDLFQAALKQARIWAAHACTTRGATSHCPSREELADFEQELRRKGQDPDLIDCRDRVAWESIFRILDKAY